MDEKNNPNMGNMNAGTNNPIVATKKKSNAVIYIIILILIIIIAALIVVRARNGSVERKTQTDADLSQSLKDDSTASINSNIDSIVIDENSDTELKGIDQELQNL
ncbi:MAG TPA: hypothetical protein VK153_00140 [Candidatus Paceibacterota bacterium]|nr:hypothetical protein [Candidatus Paceibacterota bacterium]